jgi:hypothetical protein
MDKIDRPFPRELARRREVLLDDGALVDFSPEQRSFEQLLEIKNFMWGPSRILREKADAYAESIW